VRPVEHGERGLAIAVECGKQLKPEETRDQSPCSIGRRDQPGSGGPAKRASHRVFSKLAPRP